MTDQNVALGEAVSSDIVAQPPGLNGQPENTWPAPPEPGAAPIDLLAPGSERHRLVLEYLLKRLNASERSMTAFYSRWQVAERKLQAYINLQDYEQLLKEQNDSGKIPQVISIQVPYTYATIAVIVTYLLHTFCGRKPILQIGVNKNETVESSRLMEITIQYQADHTRLVKQLFQFLTDTQTYGVGILRTKWERRIERRTKNVKADRWSFAGLAFGKQLMKQKEWRVTYSGNSVESIDPFLFFPDPRVPMTKLNREGEFVFWRSFLGKHILKTLEAQKLFKWVDYASTMLPRSEQGDSNQSVRGLRSGGESTAGWRQTELDSRLSDAYQVDQGSVEIIPRELGLGESKVPEKWMFTILNKSQIVQAEPFDADHGMHPVAVSEPYGSQYQFGNIGMADYLGPLQDTISWFINSHIYNVRSALNNMFVVDPSMVEMQDLKNPDAGKIIRLKRAAYGQDVRMALTQLQVADVTGSHVKDMEVLTKLGQVLSAVTDNLMGMQDSGGRKTATEVRTSGEAAASRLAAQARIISSQALVDLAEQMVVNTQQYLDDEFYVQIVGAEGLKTPIKVSPEQLIGDFTYPVHDGTLPLDRVAMLDTWKEILLGVAKDPELRSTFSVPKIFEWVAELGGARNIDSFKVQVNPQPMGALEAQAQAGNAIPLRQGSLAALGGQGA